MTEPAQGTSDTTQAPPGAPANPGSVPGSSGQTTSTQSGGGQPPAGFIEQAKYDGAMRILSERDSKIRKLEADIQAAQSQLKESQTSLGAREADLTAQITQLTTTVQTLTGEKGTLEKDLSGAKALLVKYEALKEYPDLLPMADSIPALADAEAMKAHLGVVKAGVDKVAQELAQKITAGLTPGATGATGQQPGQGQQFTHTTVDDWMKAMDAALADPDPSKFKALESQYLAWLAQGGPS